MTFLAIYPASMLTTEVVRQPPPPIELPEERDARLRAAMRADRKAANEVAAEQERYGQTETTLAKERVRIERKRAIRKKLRDAANEG
jgi:hypothetical protein